MPKCVHLGAKLKCSFGAGPKDMIVLPIAMAMNASKPLAAQMDFIPMLNVPAFGQCKSPLNPMNWKMIGPVPVFVPSPVFRSLSCLGPQLPRNSNYEDFQRCLLLVKQCVFGWDPLPLTNQE